MNEDKNKIAKAENQNQVAPYSQEFINKTKEFKRAWNALYEEVRQKKTKHKAKKRKISKDKYEDYLEASYMTALLNKYFPGWDFVPAHEPLVIGNRLIIAGGVLEIIDEQKFRFLTSIGVPPEKAEYKRKYYGLGGGMYHFSKETGNVIHESNPAKKAITEAFKYSINRLTGIGDDTYRREESEALSLGQYQELFIMIMEARIPEEEKQKAKEVLLDLIPSQVEAFKQKLKQKEIEYAKDTQDE